MDTPDWYPQWGPDALQDLLSKQDRLEQAFSLGRWPRYDYDLSTGTLEFSDDTGPKVRGRIQVVGTTGREDWLWGWANSHWPSDQVEDVLKVKAFGLEHGIDELTSAYLKDGDLNQLGWDMTAVATRVLNSPGAYRAPTETGALFFVFRSIGFVN